MSQGLSGDGGDEGDGAGDRAGGEDGGGLQRVPS